MKPSIGLIGLLALAAGRCRGAAARAPAAVALVALAAVAPEVVAALADRSLSRFCFFFFSFFFSFFSFLLFSLCLRFFFRSCALLSLLSLPLSSRRARGCCDISSSLISSSRLPTITQKQVVEPRHRDASSSQAQHCSSAPP